MALLYPHQRIKTVDPAKDHQLNLLKNMAPSYEEGDHRLIQTEDGRIIRLHLVSVRYLQGVIPVAKKVNCWNT